MFSIIVGGSTAVLLALIIIRLNIVRNEGRDRIQKGLLLTLHISSLIDKGQKHRGTSNALQQGNKKLLSQLESIQTEIDSLINKPQSLLLNHFPQWESFVDHWPKLKQHAVKGDIKPYHLLRQHNLMIDGLLSLLDDVMRYHELNKMMLDRNTRVADICLDTLRVAETIGQTRAIGSGICAHGVCEGADRIIINFLRDSVEKSTHELLRELHTIENSKLNYGLQHASESIRKNVSALIDLIENQVLVEGRVNVDSTKYFSVSTKAIDEVLQVFSMITTHANKHHMNLV